MLAYPYPDKPMFAKISGDSKDEIKQQIRSRLVASQSFISSLRDWYCWVIRTCAKKGYFTTDRSVELQKILKLTSKDYNLEISVIIGRLSKLTQDDIDYIHWGNNAIKYYEITYMNFAVQFLPSDAFRSFLPHDTQLTQNATEHNMLSDITSFDLSSLKKVTQVDQVEQVAAPDNVMNSITSFNKSSLKKTEITQAAPTKDNMSRMYNSLMAKIAVYNSDSTDGINGADSEWD